MATRYRDLAGLELVDTTPLETGDSEAAAALARSFKAFEGVGLDIVGDVRAEQGAQEGAQRAADFAKVEEYRKRVRSGQQLTPEEKKDFSELLAKGAGKPIEFRAGLRAQTAYGQAYNNAAMRGYAIKSEGDAEDTAARLEVEAQNDPDKFATLFGAARDEALKQAPKEARATLATIYGRRMNASVARLTQARAVEQNKIARSDLAEGLERGIDRAANLHVADDPASYELAVEEEAKLQLAIDGAVNDGTISAAEGLSLHKTTGRQLTAATISARFRKELDSPHGDPVGFIEKLRKENRTNEALDPSEEEALIDKLVSDLREHNALMSAQLSESNAMLKARYEQGNRDATAALFSGELTVGKLRDMVQRQQLDPDRATTLANELQQGDTKVDDSKEAFHVRTNLLSLSEEEIANNTKLSWKTRAELIEKRRQESETWKGTQAAREAEARIDRALGIAPGTMRAGLSAEEAEARDNALTQWYSAVDALPPNERQAAVLSTAQDVIKRVIRNNKSSEAQTWRDAKARAMADVESKGGIGALGAKARKKYEEKIANYDRQIAAAEAEAARQ
jgi:hypothetical protein